MKYALTISSILLPTLLLISSSPAAASKGEEGLVCHDTTGCYPRLFKPTHEFQRLYDDQEVPKGLHIRLDLSTGLKEAKLNDPSADSSSSSVDAVAVHLDGEEGEKEKETPRDPRLEETIKPPPEFHQEDSTFTASLSILSSPSKHTPEALSEALASLSELCHSLHWGLKLASSESTLTTLLSLTSSSSSSPLTSTPQIRAASATVLGSALSNNPAALTAALSSSPIIETLLSALETEDAQEPRTRILYALNQAVKSPASRRKFIAAEGMQTLRGVWEVGDDEVKGKIAVFVEDNFLNDDMRAEFERESEGMVVQPGGGAGGGGGGEKRMAGEEGEFCKVFQKALVGGEVGDGDVEMRVFSVLVALKRKHSGCVGSGRLREWMEEKMKKVGGEEEEEEDELRELVKGGMGLWEI